MERTGFSVGIPWTMECLNKLPYFPAVALAVEPHAAGRLSHGESTALEVERMPPFRPHAREGIVALRSPRQHQENQSDANTDHCEVRNFRVVLGMTR